MSNVLFYRSTTYPTDMLLTDLHTVIEVRGEPQAYSDNTSSGFVENMLFDRFSQSFEKHNTL